jgi:hypothetical protein
MNHTAPDVLDRLTGDDLRNKGTTPEETDRIREEIDRVRRFLTVREPVIDLGALIGFVTSTLTPLFASRNTEFGGTYWCSKWWYHADALDRFDILMRLYAAATDAESRSDWWQLHARPHMNDLMIHTESEGGCGFYGCTIRGGHRFGRNRSLPTDLPAGLLLSGLVVADAAA